ncbi:MAG: 4-alpha-glucanotransferase [Oscillospiraceae bacterium]|nr:4-alpha-glucanotransferase [Oscillospiraceae bacterium]
MRSNGVLMHIASLPSPHGIGTMGKTARQFADFLAEAGQHYWQLLPICPTGYGDSPYQSFSTNAGNPYFIDLDELKNDGLLDAQDYENIDWEASEDDINYGALYNKRYPVLRKAVAKFLENPAQDYEDFCQENSFWLRDYALFMALKSAHGGASWQQWDEQYKNHDEAALSQAEITYRDEIDFWKGVQYLFFKQWHALSRYANSKGIKIIGDLPIYVSLDGVDVWSHPELFQLDENKQPKEVAGCPPDGFSADGQLWGNPLYDWEYHEKTNFEWWTKRISYLCSVYDVLRIDHFRGFDTYFAIPFGDTTARNGVWKQGPGMKLFTAVENSIGKQPIIAEDLGYLTDSVKKLLADSTFPGMKVLEFAFDKRDENSAEYLPWKYPNNSIAYIGTHDNDTANGWMQTANPDDVKYATEFMHLTEEEGYNWGMMRTLWASGSDTTIVQFQDLLGLGSEARINTPSSVGKNWRWRAKQGSFNSELAQKLKSNMALYSRLGE